MPNSEDDEPIMEGILGFRVHHSDEEASDTEWAPSQKSQDGIDNIQTPSQSFAATEVDTPSPRNCRDRSRPFLDGLQSFTDGTQSVTATRLAQHCPMVRANNLRRLFQCQVCQTLSTVIRMLLFKAG